MTRGLFVNKYLKGPHSEINYKLSANGNLTWYDFPEPEDKTRANASNHPVPESFITVDELPNIMDDYQLYLLIKNDSAEKEIRLEGPHIENIEPLLKIEKPEVRVLDFFDTLNPFQKGGMWDFLSQGVKYDKCIYARKKARKEFTKIFNQM